MAKILIVDDSRTSRKILRGLLEGNGHEVEEAANGEEGCSRYKEWKPDLVTMDITMPVLDGMAALKMIKGYDSEAKVIMITAAGQKEKMVQAVKYGADEFIAKPYEENGVLSTVNRILEGD